MSRIHRVVVEIVCDQKITDKRLISILDRTIQAGTAYNMDELTKAGIRRSPIHVKSLSRYMTSQGEKRAMEKDEVARALGRQLNGPESMALAELVLQATARC